MAETKKPKKPKSPLIGAEAQPTTLDATTKVGIDVDKDFVDLVLEAGLSGTLDTAALDRFTTISNARDQIYQLIDTMAMDSSVSSVVRTYAEGVCEPADSGHIVWCESNDTNVSKFVNYLLNTMNVDKNVYRWTYSLIKYGDCYLRLYRESDYDDTLFNKDKVRAAETAKTQLNEGLEEDLNEAVYMNIHPASDPYSYYVEMVADPGTMFELTRYGKTYGYVETPNVDNGYDYLTTSFSGTQPSAGAFNYKMKSNDIHVYQADDFVHACLEDDFSRFPEKVCLFTDDRDYASDVNYQAYTVKRGKSMLYDAYKVWREKALLENAALLNRVTRSSIIRTIMIEVGDMPKHKIKSTIRGVKELFEQKTALNTATGNSGMVEYVNPGPFENSVYLPTHNGIGSVNVGTVGGDVDVKSLADLDYWNNKFYASFGIPKQYFGWCLSGDTEIPLLNGETVTIREMFEHIDEYIGKGIMGCAQDGSLRPTTISNVMLTNKHARILLKITLDNGEEAEVTPEHRMMLKSGEFIAAENLKAGDSLMPCSETEIKVAAIEEISTDEPVYDLTVADDCHTFPLKAGIFVHNCEDSAGFNGGTSLSIISSVFAKGIRRVQNAMLQALTDAVNLMLLNKGCKSYINNFVLKMKTPPTQEEKDYREQLSAKVSAISNMQSLFADVEDRAHKLKILKTLLKSLDYGDELMEVLDDEIEDAEKQRREAEEAAKAEAAGNAEGEPASEAPEPWGEEEPGGDFDLGLSSLAPTEEGMKPEGGTILNESPDLLLEDDLPMPEELNAHRDFSKNDYED